MVRTTRRAPKVLDKNYTPEFEAFWRAYPLKVKKGDAFASWRTHVKTAEQVAATMHALSWQVSQAEWTREGGRAIPHPTTYLNQHRWEDEPSTPVIDLTPNTRRDTVGVANAKALETYRQMKQAQERQVEGANPRRLLDDE